MEKRYLFWILVMLVWGCKNEKEVRFHNLELKEKIFEYSDSTFISKGIHSIRLNKNNLYFSEHVNNRVIKCNHEFKIETVYGRAGNGPGEFNGIEFFEIYQDSIYAFDIGGSRINVFDPAGKFIRMFNSPSFSWPTKFDISEEGIFYFSTPDKNNIISVYDHLGNFKKGFGSKNDFNFGNNKVMAAQVNICIDSEFIYGIGVFSPKIVKYSKKGKIVAKTNLFEDPLLKGYKSYTLDLMKKHKNQKNTFIQIFNNVQISDKFIYISFNNIAGKEDKKMYNILQIDKSSLKITKNYNLICSDKSNEVGWITGFLIKDKEIYTADGTYGAINNFRK